MMVVKLFFGFVVVLYMFTATCFCYADDSKLPGSQEKVDEVLKRLNKPPVKSFKSPDGYIIDCVHISHQPAFDHPLLKNHTIKMKPDYYPNSINIDDIKASSMMNASKDGPSFTQLWHSNGKCSKGTIPIRRTKKEDVLRASSVKNYGKKKGFSIGRQSLIDTELDYADGGFEFASAYSRGPLYGTKATLNTWNPKIDDDGEYSLAQIWIVGCTSDDNNAIEDINTIEAGWHVYPGLYGDTNTRLFISWTGDGYQTTGCHNLQCSGFIQTNNNIVMGGSISPTSEIDGTQHAITILIWKEQKSDNWWMQLDGETVGYWPSSLFSHLCDGASLIEWGGEVANKHSDRYHTTKMGSGQFPQQGYLKASYIRNIKTVDASNTLRIPDRLNTANERGCYDILTRVSNDNYWGTHFYFGGPGPNTNCQ